MATRTPPDEKPDKDDLIGMALEPLFRVPDKGRNSTIFPSSPLPFPGTPVSRPKVNLEFLRVINSLANDPNRVGDHRDLLRKHQELLSRYGDEFARKWIRAEITRIHQEKKERLREYRHERAQLDTQMALLEISRIHLEAHIDCVTEGFKIRSQPFVPGTSRLRVGEIFSQMQHEDRRRLLLAADAQINEFPTRKEWGRTRIPAGRLEELGRRLLRAQKFDLRSLLPEDIEPNAAFSYELEEADLFQLPFPTCWFEWEIFTSHTIGALVERREDKLVISSFVRVEDNGWANWDYLSLDHPDRHNDLAEHVERVCRAAIVLLESRCIQKIAFTRPAKTQKPLLPAFPDFAHTVVVVQGFSENERGHPSGRTHRSPRMHWRRGHLRHFRLPSGVIYRIRKISPMLIGRGPGMVTHDYLTR